MMKLEEALNELRKHEKKKFDETLDLIVNLRKFDVKKNSINAFVTLPNKIREKKICGFVELKTDLIDTITKAEFAKFKDKKQIKKLVESYDFFIGSAQLMPAVATTFGRVLGPAGKMPSPKLGIIMTENENEIKKLIEKINAVIRIQTKEPSIKIAVGKYSMKDEAIIENIHSIYNSILNELPNKKENVRSVMIKFTMTKPIKVEI